MGKLVVMVGAFLAAAGMAQAATITYSAYATDGNAWVTPSGTTYPVKLQAFDPSLGTLTGITLLIDAEFKADTNVVTSLRSGSPRYWGTYGWGSANVSGDGFSTITGSCDGVLCIGLANGTSGKSGTLGEPDWAAHFIGERVGASVEATIDPTNFRYYTSNPSSLVGNQFSEGGIVYENLSFTANDFFTGGAGDPGVYYGVTGSDRATISVTYAYDAFVPEPGAIFLLSSGLASLVLFRKRFGISRS